MVIPQACHPTPIVANILAGLSWKCKDDDVGDPTPIVAQDALAKLESDQAAMKDPTLPPEVQRAIARVRLRDRRGANRAEAGEIAPTFLIRRMLTSYLEDLLH
jgi:hypothetical protein